MKMARMGWMSPYGGLPSAISSAVMPEDGQEEVRLGSEEDGESVLGCGGEDWV